MLATIIDNSLRDAAGAKPIFDIDKEFECKFPVCYAVIIQDMITNSDRIHIYLTADEAIEKYDEYDKRLNSTLDPIEYDTISNLIRDLALIVPIRRDNTEIKCSRFEVSDIIKSNRPYNKLFDKEY
jgi:hypothetical protein